MLGAFECSECLLDGFGSECVGFPCGVDSFAERQRDNAIAQLEYEQANRRKEDAKLAHERDDFIKELETANTGMRTALEAIQEQHEPAEALMNPGRREQLVKVCTGCGTDDGNWQLWPCRTRRLADQGLGDNLARTTKNGGA